MGGAYRLTGGRIYTGRRYVESLAVEDGQVAAAGTDRAVARRAAPGAERIALGGRLVVPGLIDAHLHLGELARLRFGLDLRAVRSRAELLRRVASWAERHPHGPIVGRGWTPDRIARGPGPTGSDLDGIDPERPILLYHASGHALLVNRAARRAAGFERAAPDPVGGRVDRDSRGEPTGMVYERAMEPFGPIAGSGTPVSPGEMRDTLDWVSRFGLTAVATLSTSPEEWAGLVEVDRAGSPSLRVRAYLRANRLPEFDEGGYRPAHGRAVALVGTKSFADGAFGPRTAWLSRPYRDRPGTAGVVVRSPEELREIVQESRARGLVPAIHAIGDRAVVSAARALGTGRTGSPGRIEHAGLVPPAAQRALGRVRPILVVQPGFVWSDYWLADRLGPARSRWAYPFRTLRRQGLPLAGSSDAPYDPVDPWRGLRAAASRRDPAGRSANPHRRERLAPEEAFELYTTGAARALGDPRLGHLEPGARADFLILRSRTLAAAIRDGAAGIRERWLDGVRGVPPASR